MQGEHAHKMEEIHKNANEGMYLVQKAMFRGIMLEAVGSFEVAFLHDIPIEPACPPPTRSIEKQHLRLGQAKTIHH